VDSKNFGRSLRLRGFSLTEALVAMALVGVVALVLSEMTNLASVSSSKFTRDSDVNYLVGEITQNLSDPNNCIQTFTPLGTIPRTQAPLVNPTSIVSRSTIDRSIDPPGLSVPTNGRSLYVAADKVNAKPYGPSLLYVREYEFQGSASTESFLEVSVQEKPTSGSNLGGGRAVTRKIALNAEWDGPILKSCRSLSQASSELWSRGSGTDIYFMGRVGVGTSTPTPELALEIAGDMVVSKKGNADPKDGSITAQAFYYSSDRRLKEQVQTIRDPMKQVLALRGVSFDWRDDDKHDYGFIAQEVREGIPEIVQEDPRGQLSVDYVKVLPFLVEALKGQQREIEELKNEIERLKH